MAAFLLISGCAPSQKHPPYTEPDRLVSIVKVEPAGERPILNQNFLVLRSESKTLGPIAGYVFRGLNLTEGAPERIHSAQVTADFFSTLGVKPALGRALLSADDRPDGSPVVVIGYALWLRRFGGDPNLIGRAITLNQKPHIVVGIMPADFQFPKECDAWTLLAFDNESLSLVGKSSALEVFARLKPGVATDQAQADLDAIARKLEIEHPETNSGRDIKIVPLRESSSQQELKVLKIKLDKPATPPVKTGKEK
jgi:putative ABC transport system permease protein